MNMKFGGFIITYNRPEILLQTLDKLFQQTLSPELVWIIDNSEGMETDHAIASCLNPKINYFRMGYNSGPAGAAVKGLELCEASGLDWIFWGDDNDPPFYEDTFERLLAFKDASPICGILGSVGHFFDRKKGVIKRIQSRLLEKKDFLEVDVVAGGMSLLVNKEVVKAGIFPNKELFFGFEELDFCLKVSRRGFSIVVPCSIFLDLRELHKRTGFNRPLYKRKENLVREYYSLRNLLFISDTLTLKGMRRQLMKKWIAKMFLGFRYGLRYGIQNSKMIFLAFFHYFKGIKGKTIDL